MSEREGYVPLVGSERAPLPGAEVSGSPKPDERIRVVVILRPNPSTEGQVQIDEMNTRPPLERTYLTRDQLETLRGASRKDIASVEAFASAHSLDVADVSVARRNVVLSGTVAQVNKAFGVKLAHYKHSKGTYRGHTGPVYLPNELVPIVQAILGLDDRPQAAPRIRRAEKSGTTYTPPQVAQLYDFPSNLKGVGQSVGIIELGGGFTLNDIQTYFSGLGISPVPTVIAVSVDGTSNSPTGDSNGPDAEVMLDIEIIGSVAPAAQIVVYFAPNTDQGFFDAITQAIHDSQHMPSVISISWGSAESTWSKQGIQALNSAIQDAAALGVSVCVASGDGGSSDGVTDKLAHVDFPASSPYALGCGGTQLESSGGAITSEVVWNDQPKDGATGGGVSDVFPLPSWQANSGVPPSANPGGHVGRGVPDVCGDADPATGYSIRADGTNFVVGGTSAVAPLWSGLIALINQKLGKPVGFLNPLIYKGTLASSGVFHDITSGNNGVYSAKQGWDPCTGLGSPDGTKLEAALSSRTS